jgi:hypothetical protein
MTRERKSKERGASTSRHRSCGVSLGQAGSTRARRRDTSIEHQVRHLPISHRLGGRTAPGPLGPAVTETVDGVPLGSLTFGKSTVFSYRATPGPANLGRVGVRACPSALRRSSTCFRPCRLACHVLDSNSIFFRDSGFSQRVTSN